MTAPPVYVLGGYQTDFAVNYAKQGRTIVDIILDTVRGTLSATRIGPREIDAAHVGNFIGELMCYQGHLGAFFLEADPAFSGLPTARHEAACASGSIATLAAMAEIESGRDDCVCVLGVEMERNLPGAETAAHLGVAAWHARECVGVKYPWPMLFSRLGDEYEKRYGLDDSHLRAIGRINFANAKRNPNAQTRTWTLTDESFSDDPEKNPVVEGRVRRQDCSQVTDGGAAVILASKNFAEDYARRNGIAIDRIPRILGWGHHTARIAFDDKIAESQDSPYVLPHVRNTIVDAFARAGVSGIEAIDAIETHDCFTTTEYMAIDHFGITKPGESWKAIEEGTIAFDGKTPINPSGGLMGVGHPVGASGVRMLLDAYKQVTGAAGEYQVADAKRAATLNIGGSGTTSVSFVVGAGA
ncbi:MAG: thiolase domain-containing protein [Candidatus Hydrogenedentes bacterium]|nr:thiolase domain-containing protein [Candidatus Hydrogenedentota bacterium]